MHIDTKDKMSVFNSVELYLQEIQLPYRDIDSSRPWGGFFTFHESDASAFINEFYSGDQISIEDFPAETTLSPKLLIVEAGKRLSWQYHFRRAEIWKCIYGEVEVITSDTDEEKESRIIKKGGIIRLNKGERHRIIGTDQYGIIAEIWQHTDPDNPSNEDDIVRLQDDFGRK